MDKKIMHQLIKEEVSRRLGDGFKVEIQKIYKTNHKREVLAIESSPSGIVPVLWLEPYCKDLEGNMPLEDVVTDILDDYLWAMEHPENFDISAMTDFSTAKDKLYIRLINRHLNEEMLTKVPHSLFLDDFAVTVHRLIQLDANGHASILIDNKCMSKWGISKEELLSYAVQNSRKLLGVKLKSMAELMEELFPCSFFKAEADIPIWVLTNEQKYFGASSILYDDVLKNFAKSFGSFFVIFSSVHEALLIPARYGSDIGSLSRMNISVNKDQLKQEEILGTKAYYYSKDNGFGM